MELRSRKPLGQVGHEPDYRFSLANERTFLAWIRTALALDAGGLGVARLLPEFGIPGSREIVGVGLIVLGTIVAATSYQRWESNERSVRKDEPLGYTRLPLFLAIGVSLISGIAIVLLLTGRLG
ncbi:MAG: YidH family protein [Egibacteraceae bacterium]